MAYRKKGIYEVFYDNVCPPMRDDMVCHAEDFPAKAIWYRKRNRAELEFANILQSEIAENILKLLIELYVQLPMKESLFLEEEIYDDLSELYYRSDYRFKPRDYKPNFNIGKPENRRLAILQEFVPYLVRYGLVFDLVMKDLEQRLYDI